MTKLNSTTRKIMQAKKDFKSRNSGSFMMSSDLQKNPYSNSNKQVHCDVMQVDNNMLLSKINIKNIDHTIGDQKDDDNVNSLRIPIELGKSRMNSTATTVSPMSHRVTSSSNYSIGRKNNDSLTLY